jgi:hypothetical protein
MNKGSRLWIISDEMSISKLTKPNTQIPEGMWRNERSTGASTFIGQFFHEILARPDETTPARMDILLLTVGLIYCCVRGWREQLMTHGRWRMAQVGAGGGVLRKASPLRVVTWLTTPVRFLAITIYSGNPDG